MFARSDALRRAVAYLAGLLSGAERKNSWQLAEMSGDPNPLSCQRMDGSRTALVQAVKDQALSLFCEIGKVIVENGLLMGI